MKNLSLLTVFLLLTISALGQIQNKNGRMKFNKETRKFQKANSENVCENPKDYMYIDFDKISEGFDKEIIKIDVKTISQAPPFNPSNSEITFVGKYHKNKNYNGYAYVLYKESKIGGVILKRDFGEKLLKDGFIIQKSPMSNCINKNGGTWQAVWGCMFDAIFYNSDFEATYRD